MKSSKRAIGFVYDVMKIITVAYLSLLKLPLYMDLSFDYSARTIP